MGRLKMPERPDKNASRITRGLALQELTVTDQMTGIGKCNTWKWRTKSFNAEAACSYQTWWQYSNGEPLTRQKNRDFRPIYGFGIDEWWSVDVANNFDREVSLQNRASASVYSGRRSRQNVTHQRIFTPSHESCSVINKLPWSNYVYDTKRRRHFYHSTGTPKRTEQNLIRIGTSEADVTNKIIKDCAWGIVLLKLTRDRHSRTASLQQQRFLFICVP